MIVKLGVGGRREIEREWGGAISVTNSLEPAAAAIEDTGGAARTSGAGGAWKHKTAQKHASRGTPTQQSASPGASVP